MRFPHVLRIFVLMISAYLVAPIVVVMIGAFQESGSFQFPPTALTLQGFAAFFDSESFVDAFITSILVAAVVATAATVLGGLAAVAIVRFAGRAAAFIEAIFLAPIVVPGVLLGAALLLLFWRTGVRGTLGALVAGHLVIAMPYALQTITAGLIGRGSGLEEAAVSLGATPLQAFCKVTLPLIRSSLISAAVFAFVISFSDINLALFLSGPLTVTLPMVIFADISNLGGLPVVAAASTLQIMLVAALLLIFRGSIWQPVAGR